MMKYYEDNNEYERIEKNMKKQWRWLDMRSKELEKEADIERQKRVNEYEERREENA